MATKEFNITGNGVQYMNDVAQASESSANSFKSAKAELRALQNQMLEMDQSSEEFQKASSRAAELKDNIGDLAQELSANAGNAFEGVANNAALFGQRLLSLDLKGAGAALKGLGTSLRGVNFKTLKDEIGGFVSGLGSLGKSLLANPIFLIGGIIVGAVAAISMNLDKIISYFPAIETALTGVNRIDKMAAENAERRYEAAKKNYELIGLQEQKMRYQGATERQILEDKIAGIAAAIKEGEIRLEMSKKQAKAQIETAKANYETTKWWVEQISFVIVNLLKGIDAIRQASGETSTLAKDFVDWGAKLVFDPAEVEAELNKTIAEQEAGLAQMNTDYWTFKNQLKEIDKRAQDERNKIKEDEKKKEEDKIKEENKREEDRLKFQREAGNALLEEREKIQEEIYQSGLNAEQKEIRAIQDQYFEKIELAKQFGLDATNLELEQAQLIQAIKDKYAEEGIEKDKKEKEKLAEQQKTFNEAIIESEQKLSEAKWSVANAGLDLLGTLAGKNKKVADALFLVQKGMAIAQVVIDTQKEIAGYYSNPTWSLMPDGGLAIKTANAAAAKLRAATSIATIVGSSIGRFMNGGSVGGGGNNGGGGGGNLGGGGMSPNPLSLSFLQNQPNQQPPFQAYVISGQVSNSIEAQQLINNQSKL